MAPKPTTVPLANWKAWVSRREAEGGDQAARAARHLDGMSASHPDLKGVSLDQREAWSRRLHTASKGA